LSHLAHDEVRPHQTGAAAATAAAAHLDSSGATVVNLGSGTVSAAHLGSRAAAVLRDDGEKRNMGGWGILARKIGFSRAHRLIRPS